MGNYPEIRLRRNRQHPWLRELVAETTISAKDLVLPLFVIEGDNIREPVLTMPGVERLSIDQLVIDVKRAERAGILAVILFPVINSSIKSELAEESYNHNNLICRAIKELKKHISIGIFADVALDPYTTHGHDGLVIDGYVHNDKSIEVLCKQAIALAQAGCDFVAPSDMMDGRVESIRTALDSKNFQNVGILAYSAKYASSFYGPFREAVNSGESLGKSDKFTYQMDTRNAEEAMREIELDIKEGADMIMIKPALAYLDIIRMANDRFKLPIVAYQVSGEYAMLKLAAANGLIDFDKAMMESLIAIKRAGAQIILTYAAMNVVEKLCKNTL